MVKYSIILPVHNAIKYLKTCVESITQLNYNDYEFIISDNNSSDGTKDYLNKINNKHIKVFHTPKLLPHHESWDYALNKATGEWQMLIGADDAVTPYFFQTADLLVKIAEKKKINIIKSNRIYFFWDDPITQEIYNNNVIYNIKNKISIKKTKKIFNSALYGNEFFDMPQMYTTSLFKKSFIEKIKEEQNDSHIIFYNSPDAYLGVLACCREKKYLYSELPLGWVGSSSNSQGLKNGREYFNQKVELPKDDYRNFSENTYKTINSTNILVAGALKKIKESKLKLKNHFKIKNEKLILSVIENKKNDAQHSIYIKDLLDAFNFFYDENKIQNKTKKHILIRIFRKIKNFIILFWLKCDRYKTISFSYNNKLDSVNQNFITYDEINNYLKNSNDIKNILSNCELKYSSNHTKKNKVF